MVPTEKSNRGKLPGGVIKLDWARQGCEGGICGPGILRRAREVEE